MQRCMKGYLTQQNNIQKYRLFSYNYKEHQEKTICLLFNAAWKEVGVLKEGEEWGNSIDEASDSDEDCSRVIEL